MKNSLTGMQVTWVQGGRQYKGTIASNGPKVGTLTVAMIEGGRVRILTVAAADITAIEEVNVSSIIAQRSEFLAAA